MHLCEADLSAFASCPSNDKENSTQFEFTFSFVLRGISVFVLIFIGIDYSYKAAVENGFGAAVLNSSVL